MTDLILVAVISSIPPTLMASGALIASLKNRNKIDAVHTIVNNEKTERLMMFATALLRIARENPDDLLAQAASSLADKAAASAQRSGNM